MTRIPSWLRGLVGPLLLVGLFLLLDPTVVLERLASVDPRWVLIALGIGVAQTLLSAWRWRYTAGRLGLDLPFRSALAEYYLATFLNQVLPGGVLGDATRAWRHADRSGFGTSDSGPAVRAVVFERASGQMVMVAVAALSLLVLAARDGRTVSIPVAVGLGILVLLAAFTVGRFRAEGRGGRTPKTLLGQTLRDARRTLWDGSALAVQLATSTLIVGSYVVTYLCAARAVGVGTPFLELAPLVAPVLLAMLIPFSVAGWGLREGAAAAMWVAVGMSASEGVAISVAYGGIVALGTLPGAVVLALGGYGSLRAAARKSRSKSTSSPSVK